MSAETLTTWPAMMGVESVARYVDLSRSLIWKLVSSKKFPAPITIPGARVARWRRADLDAWLNELEASK
jgi:excisionase family DNA binding protein